jgi:hypothetical protein
LPLRSQQVDLGRGIATINTNGWNRFDLLLQPFF